VKTAKGDNSKNSADSEGSRMASHIGIGTENRREISVIKEVKYRQI
jgi:hypothetical protein